LVAAGIALAQDACPLRALGRQLALVRHRAI
jgi:hypothetical protein